MDRSTVDAAIDLLTQGEENLANSVIGVIVQGGEGFEAACNAVSLRAAARFLEGDLEFTAVDDVVNWIWSYVNYPGFPRGLPEPALSIYEAVDAGEHHHTGDNPDINPVERHTVPALRLILDDPRRSG